MRSARPSGLRVGGRSRYSTARSGLVSGPRSSAQRLIPIVSASRLDRFDPCKVKGVLRSLSSRIAAARSSSLVKNFGWLACMNLRSQSRQPRCSSSAFSESCCCLFFMTGYFYVMQPGAPCKYDDGETGSNYEKCRKFSNSYVISVS